MRSFIAIIILTLISFQVKGQDTIPEPELLPKKDTVSKFHFGFVLGINASSIKVSKTNIYNLTGEWLDSLKRSEFANVGGIYMGFLFQYDLSSRFAIRASPGFNMFKYAMTYYWNNGKDNLIVRPLVFFQLPLHLSIMVPVKKCRLSFLPGVNLVYHHSTYDFANEPRFFTATDLRVEFSRRMKKNIIGIEFGFNRSFKTHEMQMAPRVNYSKVTDLVKPGSYMFGLIFKY